MLKENFIRYLEVERRYSPRTVRLYDAAVTDYFAFLEESDPTPELMTPQYIRSFIARGLDSGLSARTLNLRLSALSTWCNWLLREGLLDSNPVHKVPRPKQEKKLPQFYTEKAIDNYFDERHLIQIIEVNHRIVHEYHHKYLNLDLFLTK